MKPKRSRASHAGAGSLRKTRGESGGVRAGRLVNFGVLLGCTSALIGCINIAAPEEPIVIELNINIRQEVILRLAEQAADTVEENADIF